MEKACVVFSHSTIVELIISRVQQLTQKNRGAQLQEITIVMDCGGIVLVSVCFV
jgi:hypothetical protein